MDPSSKVIKQLALDKKQTAIEKYTDEALQKTTLTAEEKIKLIELNQHNRLSIIKRVQKHTLEHLFRKKPDSFFKSIYHYDWWVFPMHVPASWNWPKRNYDASIKDIDEAKTLLLDHEFVETYLSCTNLYIDSLEQYGWSNYPVRYARMLHSLALFIYAASQSEHMEHEYKLLYETGSKAIEYATRNIHSETNYPLFKDGLSATQTELKRFELREVKEAQASL